MHVCMYARLIHAWKHDSIACQAITLLGRNQCCTYLEPCCRHWNRRSRCKGEVSRDASLCNCQLWQHLRATETTGPRQSNCELQMWSVSRDLPTRAGQRDANWNSLFTYDFLSWCCLRLTYWKRRVNRWTPACVSGWWRCIGMQIVNFLIGCSTSGSTNLCIGPIVVVMLRSYEIPFN